MLVRKLDRVHRLGKPARLASQLDGAQETLTADGGSIDEPHNKGRAQVTLRASSTVCRSAHAAPLAQPVRENGARSMPRHGRSQVIHLPVMCPIARARD